MKRVGLFIGLGLVLLVLGVFVSTNALSSVGGFFRSQHKEASSSAVADAESLLFRLAALEAQPAQAAVVQPIDEFPSHEPIEESEPLIEPPAQEVEAVSVSHSVQEPAASAELEQVPMETDHAKMSHPVIPEKFIEDLARYRVRVNELESQLSRQSTELAHLQREVNDRATQLGSREKEVSDLQSVASRLNQVERENGILRAEQELSNSTKQELEKVRTERDSLLQQKDRLAEEVARLRAETKSLKDLAEQRDRLTASWEEERKKVSTLGESKQALESEKSELQAQLSEATKRNAALEDARKASENAVLAARRETEGLREQLKSAERTRADLHRAIDGLKELKEKKDSVEKELASVRGELTQIREKESAVSAELELRTKDLAARQAELSKNQRDLVSTREELAKLQDSSAKANAELLQLRDTAESLRQQVSEQGKELASLQTEYLMKKKELEMLSASTQVQPAPAQVPMFRSQGTPQGSIDSAPVRRPSGYGNMNSQPVIGTTPAGGTPRPDAMIVQVTAPKVNLRTGPGEEHSPVMQVRGGTRLTVESIEGEWFRVFSPTGSRAYIRRDVVVPVNSVTGKPELSVGQVLSIDGRPVSSQTFSPDEMKNVGADDRAFQEIKRALRSK